MRLFQQHIRYLLINLDNLLYHREGCLVILVLTPFDQLDNFVALLLFLPFLLQLDLLLRQIIALQFFLVAVDELYQLLLANILRDIFVALFGFAVFCL